MENDENQNENNIDARDVKFTIKSNETNYQMNVRTGMANYKCKFLGKQEVDGKVGFTVFFEENERTRVQSYPHHTRLLPSTVTQAKNSKQRI